MKKLIDFISKPAAYAVLAALVIFLVIIPDFTQAPIGPNAFKEHAGGNPLIDMQLNYSTEEVYKLIEAYGEDGRNYYIKMIFALDFIIPLGFMMFILATMNLILRKAKLENYMNRLAVIPFAGCISDYMENICTTAMVMKYPLRLNGIAAVSNIFSLSKMLFCTAGVLAVFAAMVYLFFNKYRKKIA
ncbi:MAG: hypothetical protein N3I35_05080 [Clostridia bacterium]|nr:hypothetical protein [Clostridia bacterium]